MKLDDFQIDNSSILEQHIKDETEKQLEALQKSLDELKEKKERLAKIEITRLQSQFRKKEEEEKEKIQKAVLGKIEPDKKVSILKQKGRLLAELMEMLEDRFYKIYQTPQYSRLLQMLLQDIAETLQDDFAVVYIHPDDKEKLDLSSFSVEVKGNSEIHGLQGSDKNEHLLVDNSLKGWLRKKRDDVKKIFIKEIDALYNEFV